MLNPLENARAIFDVLYNFERRGETKLEYAGNLMLTSVQLVFGGKVCSIFHKEDRSSGGIEGYQITEERRTWKTKAELAGNIALAFLFIPALPLGLIMKPISLIDPEVRKANLGLIELVKKELFPLTKTLSINGNEYPNDNDFLTQLPPEIKNQITPYLTDQELVNLMSTSKLWQEFGRNKLMEMIYPESFIQLFGGIEEFCKLPVIKLKAHPAGTNVEGMLLVQKFGSKEFSTSINFIEPSDMEDYPIVRFMDPWGRPGIAIRYIHRVEESANKITLVENVLVLHRKGKNLKDPWICSVKTNMKEEAPLSEKNRGMDKVLKKNPAAFFPKGCEKMEKSLEYLKKLLKREACGLPIQIVDESGEYEVVEGINTFKSPWDESLPVIELYHSK